MNAPSYIIHWKSTTKGISRDLLDLTNLCTIKHIVLKRYFIQKAETTSLYEVIVTSNIGYTLIYLELQSQATNITTVKDKKKVWGQKHFMLDTFMRPKLQRGSGMALLVGEIERFIIAILNQSIAKNNYKTYIKKPDSC